MIKITNTYLNSCPVVFHHNGRPSRFNHPSGVSLKRKVFEYFSDGTGQTFRGRKEKTNLCLPKKSDTYNELSEKLTIFMVTNLEEKGSAARSLDYFNLPYTIVGSDIVNYTPFDKLNKLVEFIPKVETEYMMLFDTDDVFITDGLDRVVNTFEKEMGCKMLFNAECWNYPKGDKEQTAFEEDVTSEENPFRYLNSGVWVANTEFLKSKIDVLEELKNYSHDDQAVFKRFYKMFYPDVKVDHNCKYFQSLTWSAWFEEHYPNRMDMEVTVL
jgi:hypothetical protein